MTNTLSGKEPSSMASRIEERTQQLGRGLWDKARRYRRGPMEVLQDWLLTRAMADDAFRSRLLLLIDALVALESDREGRHLRRLLREYFAEDSPRAPALFRMALRIARYRWTPASTVASTARLLTELMAQRFVVEGGPNAAWQALWDLEEHHRAGSFSVLGEKVVSQEEAEAYAQRHLELINHLKRHPAASRRTAGSLPQVQLSLKPSAFTADFDPEDPEGTFRRLRPQLESVLQAARQAGIGVNLDAEQYEYRDLTWYIFQRLFRRGEPYGDWEDGGMVVQAYLRDAYEHLEEVITFAQSRGTPFQVRLVKGAYWDHESILSGQTGWPRPVCSEKADTDAAFEQLTQRLLAAYPSVGLAIGSHNLRCHAYAEALREELGLPVGTVEHQTLYRTAEATSRALARMGWPERDYVPVGEIVQGMAYLVRRVLENASQLGFLMRSRAGSSVEKLLAPPEPAAVARTPERSSEGFRNVPPRRLFLTKERAAFEAALSALKSEGETEYPLLIGGERVETDLRMPSYNPSRWPDGPPLGWVHLADEQAAQWAVDTANAASEAWAATKIEQRARLLRQAAERLLATRDEMAAQLVLEAGKIPDEALAEVDETIDYLNYYAYQAERLAPVWESAYAPRGIVAVIPPWNFPLAIPCGMVAAALVTGNCVILKPAEDTPIVAAKLVALLREAGIPQDALTLLPGEGETVGRFLVESPEVDMVAFTGSKEVGTLIYATASRVRTCRAGLKKVVAEMGGKNAILVFADADRDEAVAGIIRSTFGYANQKCSACSRVLIQRPIYTALVSRLLSAVRSLELGPADVPGTRINPLISPAAKKKVASYVEAARREAHILLDRSAEAPAESLLCGPVVCEVDPQAAYSASVAQEEVFGPLLTLIPFDTEEQALALANSTPFALTGGVYSRSPATIGRVIRELRAGNIYVNRSVTGARVAIEPFGGFQMSGTGPKAGGEDYLLAFVRRRDGWRAGSIGFSETSPAFGSVATIDIPPIELRPWDEEDPLGRARRLRGAARLLRSLPRPEGDTAGLWGVAAEAIEETVEAVNEIADPQPTREIPGQRNFNTWTTPRGVGLVVTDEGAPIASLPAIIAAALLAGNGVLVMPPEGLRPAAHDLVDALHAAGIPHHVLGMAPPGGVSTIRRLCAAPELTFVACDVGLDLAQRIYAVLGQTKEGQRHLKALIALAEGPQPGEPGWLQRFAVPKTIAIRTLRHGADLALP